MQWLFPLSLPVFLHSDSPCVGGSLQNSGLQVLLGAATPAQSKPKAEETNFKPCLGTAQGQTLPASPTAGLPAPRGAEASATHTHRAGISSGWFLFGKSPAGGSPCAWVIHQLSPSFSQHQLPAAFRCQQTMPACFPRLFNRSVTAM